MSAPHPAALALPHECDVCGDEEDPTGISDRVRIVGVCAICTAVCCGACLPEGRRTKCINCQETLDDEDD